MIRASVVAILVLTIGPPALGQARLIAIDTVHLSEDADSYLDLPVFLYADGDGYLVTDGKQSSIFRYNRHGELTQRYGKEGEGPGEFRSARAALPYTDAQIIALTWRPAALHLFDRTSGAFVERYPLQLTQLTVIVSGDTVWLGGASYAANAGVERFRLGLGESQMFGPLPSSFTEGGPVGGIFPRVSMASWADTLMVGFEPTNVIQVLDGNGDLVEALEIPRVRRRGVPEQLQERLLEAMQGYYPAVFGTLSSLQGLQRLSDGTTALIHFDSRPEDPPVSSEAFLSILANDRQSACVDTSIPLGPDARPIINFKADTLLVLEQVVGDGFDVATIIARYLIDKNPCRWIPTSVVER